MNLFLHIGHEWKTLNTEKARQHRRSQRNFIHAWADGLWLMQELVKELTVNEMSFKMKRILKLVYFELSVIFHVKISQIGLNLTVSRLSYNSPSELESLRTVVWRLGQNSHVLS